jgi:tRNA(Ile2) C34 agmatinyltransferase TiaS
MAENTSRPTCPQCRKPMHFIVTENRGRKFRCLKCDDVDPLRRPDVQGWIRSELQPPTMS